MKTIPSQKPRIGGSIENTSILRKFTVLFLLAAIIPTLFLYYLYSQMRDHGSVQISEANFNITLIFVVSGVIVAFMAMRAVFQKIIDLTEANKKALEKVLGPEVVKDLQGEKNEIAVLTRSFMEITSRLEDNIRSLELAKQTLHSVMAKVGSGISSMQNIDKFLELILETVTNAMAGKVGVIWLRGDSMDETENEFYVKTVYGVSFKESDPIKIKVKRGSSFDVLLDSPKVHVLTKIMPEMSRAKRYADFFVFPLLCVPLYFQNKVQGFITVGGRKSTGNFEEDEINIIANVAAQTSVAIENSRLNEDIEKTYFETISALALAVEAKDKYSRGHLDRVAKYCIQMAKKLGLDEEEITILRDAARLHDLGKIGIPDEVLGKKGPLNEQEQSLMRKHPEIGESIIKPVRSLSRLCDIIRHHHEKLDGSGYPDGLKGDEITPLVRITTVADIFDALSTDRPYRNKFSIQESCHELRKMKDQLDQDIVEAFIETLDGTNGVRPQRL